jgi:CHAD domain-containing protein
MAECLDTYDRRWSRQRQIWLRSDETMTLVSPPSTFALSQDASQFGLQKPLTLGRVTLRIRSVNFDAGQGFVEGQIIKFRRQSWLVLRGRDEIYETLVSVLTAEGLQPLPVDAGWWVTDRGPAFFPPAAWPPLQPEEAAGPALAARLSDGFRVARQYEKGIRDDIDTECLHQYRVHLRRVRSLASLGRLWETVPAWDRLKELLSRLQTETNELRDLDVLLLDLPGLRDQLPWGEGAHLAAWEKSVATRRRAELRRVKTWLESEEHIQLTAEVVSLIETLVSSGAVWTAAELAEQAFAKAAGGLRKLLKKLPDEPADETLHEVRIRAKKLRYVLDGLGSLGHSGAVKALTTALKNTQDALGRFQDRSVLLDRLKRGLEGARSGKTDPLAYGLLVGVIAADHGRRKAEARTDAQTLASRSFLKALERLAPPPPPEVRDGQ